MDTFALMALSPLDGRYHAKVDSLRPIFSEFGLIKYRVMVEVRWLMFLSEQAALPEMGKLKPQQQTVLETLVRDFSTEDASRIKDIESRINHDVKAVEYFIKEKLGTSDNNEALGEFIHFGCTSEDINNLAYALMLKTACQDVMLPELEKLMTVLKGFAHRYAGTAMLARTHGQPATPTTVGKEMANTLARLQRQAVQLKETVLLGKLNGATGNYNAFAIAYPQLNWPALSEKFISSLGLHCNAYTTQIEPHDTLSELFGIMIRLNTILIDFTRDTWGYISLNYFTQKPVANEVGSSTMPHKINPIDFENAEGNLGIANALFQHMIVKLPISRWQRDLSDSTVLRNMGVAFGHALLAYQATVKGLNKLEPHLALIQQDLDNHWEVLSEPIQTVMRRYGLQQPYEKLKAFTRGKQIDKKMLHEFINQLDLTPDVKKQLLALTPSNYIGYAESLAKEV